MELDSEYYFIKGIGRTQSPVYIAYYGYAN